VVNPCKQSETYRENIVQTGKAQDTNNRKVTIMLRLLGYYIAKM
jgi:hypothetical protein